MLNYWNRQDNPATFETLEEVRAHAVGVTEKLSGNGRFPQILNPALEGFPEGLAYIYRSPMLYGGETAARNNTSFILCADRRFGDKAAAKAWLEELGLIRLMDEAIGTILLITPEREEGYGEEDLQRCYALIQALYSQKAFVERDGKRCVPAESEYCGGYGKTYLFGVGRGATFINNYLAGSRDTLIGRMAGVFTYGGEMDDAARVSGYVPAFLVNGCAAALGKFRRANGTNAYALREGISHFYNRSVPLRQVRAARDQGQGVGWWMEKAYRSMLMFLQRSANVSTPYLEPRVTGAYLGYVPAPPISRFALSPRNPILNGRTAVGGLQVTLVHDGERFRDVKCQEDGLPFAQAGDYLDCWYEVLPQAVLHNTAPAHSVPLLLANHGGGDDHLMFLDETGLLLTAGQQGFAIVAPMHSGITVIAGQVLPRLVEYMLEKYPALDPERVWVTGYSMGGMATYNCIAARPELFAAACPMAMPLQSLPEDAAKRFEKLDLPAMLITSGNDFAAWDAEHNHLNEGGRFFLQTYCRFNGIEPVKDFDYAAYPVIGRPFDSFRLTTVNGEWRNGEWLIHNDRGVPMMGLNVTEYLQHSLWPGYGDIAYSFLRHYRRCRDTGEIRYTD